MRVMHEGSDAASREWRCSQDALIAALCCAGLVVHHRAVQGSRLSALGHTCLHWALYGSTRNMIVTGSPRAIVLTCHRSHGVGTAPPMPGGATPCTQGDCLRDVCFEIMEGT